MAIAWNVGLCMPCSLTKPKPPWNGPMPPPPSSNTSVKVQYEIESASGAPLRNARTMYVAAKSGVVDRVAAGRRASTTR